MIAPTAVILCGGQGTRLRPVIGDELPKCLAPVAGKPFIEYIFNHLIGQGVKVAVLCLGHGHRRVCEKYRAGCHPNFGMYKNLSLVFSIEEEPLGAWGAIKQAASLLTSDPLLIMNGDTFCDFHLTRVMERYEGYALSLYCINDGQQFWDFSGVMLVSKKAINDTPNEYYGVSPGIALMGKSWKFHDIGTPERYDKAEAFLRERGIVQ